MSIFVFFWILSFSCWFLVFLCVYMRVAWFRLLFICLVKKSFIELGNSWFSTRPSTWGYECPCVLQKFTEIGNLGAIGAPTRACGCLGGLLGRLHGCVARPTWLCDPRNLGLPSFLRDIGTFPSPHWYSHTRVSTHVTFWHLRPARHKGWGMPLCPHEAK